MGKLNSILVGKAIINILQADAEVKKLLDEKIFPLVADENTTFPFMVYRRNGLDVEGNKDSFVDEQNVKMEFAVASDSYGSSLNIAIKVTDALVGKRGAFLGINISRIELSDATEDYIDDAYVQNLVFKIKIE